MKIAGFADFATSTQKKCHNRSRQNDNDDDENGQQQSSAVYNLEIGKLAFITSIDGRRSSWLGRVMMHFWRPIKIYGLHTSRQLRLFW
jgi:hypothetical protein